MLQNSDKYRCSIIGCVGKDKNGARLETIFKSLNILPILEYHNSDSTSRCGVGILTKERCLLAEINASKDLSILFAHTNEVNNIYHILYNILFTLFTSSTFLNINIKANYQ